jgi:uncharacterized ParB-like nuclease family protein
MILKELTGKARLKIEHLAISGCYLPLVRTQAFHKRSLDYKACSSGIRCNPDSPLSLYLGVPRYLIPHFG